MTDYSIKFRETFNLLDEDDRQAFAQRHQVGDDAFMAAMRQRMFE